MDTTTYSFSSGKYTQMFVLAKRGAARVGSVWVRACDEGHTQTFYFKFDDYEPCTLKLKENTQYEIGVQDCAVELAYFCGALYKRESGRSLYTDLPQPVPFRTYPQLAE